MSALKDVGVDVRGAAVADLGAGYGTISVALAEGGAEVTAVDVNEERLAQIRCRAERAGASVRTLQANLLEPPPLERAFDLALLVGVVEYAGLWDEKAPVEQLQQRVIETAAALLRPGGTLVLATKNRAWPGFAVRDVHTKQPLVDYLPRSLADHYSRARYGTPYRHHVHTPAGWRQIVQRGGFSDVRTFVPYFSYQFPLAVVDAPRLGDRVRLQRAAEGVGEEEASAVHGRFPAVKLAVMALGRALRLPLSHSVILVGRR